MQVLLAEDEKELSRALTAILEHEAYHVDAVYHGEAALEQGLQGSYDVIILDIMMPKMDGITVLHHLRQQGVATPVLMLTAKAQVNDRIYGLDAGANDYLAKPFAMGELLARLRALTRRNEDLIPGTLQFANMTLDRTTLELATDKAAIRLGNKEFQMLELLLRNAGRPLSTEQLMERLWANSKEEDQVIWIYVSYLRKKLASLEAEVTIYGSREEGYCLEQVANG